MLASSSRPSLSTTLDGSSSPCVPDILLQICRDVTTWVSRSCAGPCPLPDPLARLRNGLIAAPQAREWIAFADLELSHGNNERVNAIFGQCLRKSPSVALWQFYLTYIRRTNPIDRSSPERAALARDIITKAFEFSLAHVGTDIEAGSIWHDYIEFLKEGDVSALLLLAPGLPAAQIGAWCSC